LQVSLRALRGKNILIFLNDRITYKQSFFRTLHAQNPEGAELHTLGVSETKMTFDGTVPLGVEPWTGRPEMLLAGFDTFLATDAYSFIDNPGICAPLSIHLQGRHRTGLEAGGIRALMTDFRLVVSVEVFLFQNNPRKGGRIAAPAVEIGADHFANPAPRAETLIGQENSSGQGDLLPIGKGYNLEPLPESDYTSQGKRTEGKSFENGAPGYFLVVSHEIMGRVSISKSQVGRQNICIDMNLNLETFSLAIFLYVAGGEKKGRVVLGPMDSPVSLIMSL